MGGCLLQQDAILSLPFADFRGDDAVAGLQALEDLQVVERHLPRFDRGLRGVTAGRIELVDIDGRVVLHVCRLPHIEGVRQLADVDRPFDLELRTGARGTDLGANSPAAFGDRSRASRGFFAAGGQDANAGERALTRGTVPFLSALEVHLGLENGTIKVYVLVEQVEACFQLMEIRAALGKPADPERLRIVRAIETLEAIGNREALKVLEKLAGGLPGARTTEEADAASKRLTRRLAER